MRGLSGGVSLLFTNILSQVPCSSQWSLSPGGRVTEGAPGWNTNENMATGFNPGSLPGQLEVGKEKKPKDHEAGKGGTRRVDSPKWTCASEHQGVRWAWVSS